jgi:hypothetical protein
MVAKTAVRVQTVKSQKGEEKMNTRTGATPIWFTGLISILLMCTGGCTLRLKDTTAPSLQADLETQYEVSRWGDAKVGFVPTPPEVKEKRISRAGVGFHVRARFSNTFTWTNPEGSLDSDYTIFGEHHTSSIPMKASGWGYRGRLSIMPGFSFADDNLFLCPVFVGVEGNYMGLDLKEEGSPGTGSWANFGRVGVPIGFHIEGTIVHTVTPYFTFAYIPTLYNGGAALAGHDFTFQVGARLWPGSLVPALGNNLWVETGWLWTVSSGVSDPFGALQTDLEIGGPVVGLGLRF